MTSFILASLVLFKPQCLHTKSNFFNVSASQGPLSKETKEIKKTICLKFDELLSLLSYFVGLQILVWCRYDNSFLFSVIPIPKY